jgi:hypothetical protein
LTLFSIFIGVDGKRFRALRDVWRDRADIRARRAIVQESRRVGDSELLNGGGVELAGRMGRFAPMRAATRVVTFVLGAYWRLVRPLL